MRIMVTGGAGYIGSHTVMELLEAGHDVAVVDNLANSSEESLERVKQMSGKDLDFFRVDLLDATALDRVIAEIAPDAVLHFAGLKAVGESALEPVRYYQTNLTGTLHLLDSMKRHGVRTLVFSSSATVYDPRVEPPFDEEAPLGAVNPYGRTKEYLEGIMTDLCAADASWSIGILRYFNPVGAHPSGRIGEDPRGIPNNLLPFVAQVAVGRREHVTVFGQDYPTHDGTGVRDYLHVQDLAAGHVAALNYLSDTSGVHRWNLGTGVGHSVLDIIGAFERASGRNIPYILGPRREGDVATSLANPALALRELGWKARHGLDEMCEDHWRWQSQNPTGYGIAGSQEENLARAKRSPLE